MLRTSASRLHAGTVAGSTVKGEEALVPRAFHRLRSANNSVLLVIAPRHPSVAEVDQRCRRRVGGRKAQDLAIDVEPRVDIICSAISELATLYQIATVVFVGGSLVTMAATTFWSRQNSANRLSQPACGELHRDCRGVLSNGAGPAQR